jgi:sterol desaturase/sphingolipid hydroxylase (fatty acid hydroxylase superfamily)
MAQTNGQMRYNRNSHFVVTPDFHHWHHSSDSIALDKNYAAHFAFLDYIFRTVAKTDGKLFPEKYGVVGDYMPDGFVKQQLSPFKKSAPGG